MKLSQIPTVVASPKGSARDRLDAFLEKRREANRPVADLEVFERKLHQMFAAAEAEAMGEELERYDVDAPEILIDGVRHLRVLRCRQTYLTASGPVEVERSLYSTRQDGERAACPMELRAGIVGPKTSSGPWTRQGRQLECRPLRAPTEA